MTSITNGMTPAQVINTIAVNTEYYQIAFGETIDVPTVDDPFVTDVATILSSIAITCDVAVPNITYGMKGSAFRSLVNSQFTGNALTAGFIANQKVWTFPFHYAVADGQLTLDFLMTTTKILLINWGNGETVTITGEPQDGAPGWTFHHKIETSEYTEEAIYIVRVTGYLKDVYGIIVVNDGVYNDFRGYEVFTNLVEIYNDSHNTWGSINYLPVTLQTLIIEHGEMITGSIDNFPHSLKTFSAAYWYQNNVTGNIDNLHEGMLTFYWVGKNGLTGSLDNLPTTLIAWCVTFMGDENLEQPSETANGQLTGNISNLKTRCPDLYYLSGNNLGDTITGSINDLGTKVQIWYMGNIGKTNITGALAHFPATLDYCALQTMGDLISGNIEDIPIGVIFINIVNTSGVVYGGGEIKAMTLTRGIIINNNWTTAMVDAFLIGCAAGLPVTATGQIITLTGTNEARSAASDVAVVTLTTNGYVVTTN